ncbi:HAMP domain-containing sensor histidine kinase [Geodermatophilus sp. YIM 151500]|uniref:sensor histidine kinase n=1 Tax=Geodermatophilus sp. YIM 151500 TaxID=2984531 RepID=UPI00296238AB|nr:HAMP domain-containing sensor histidine kinase [Geodermatophilus sp. YIM 151500]
MTPRASLAERVARVPLRVLLVALLVALVTVALLATGVAATSLLRSYQDEQRDLRLGTAIAELRNDPARVLEACSGRRPVGGSNDYLGCVTGGGRWQMASGPFWDQGSLPDLSRLPDRSDGGGRDADDDRRGPGGSHGEGLRLATVPADDGSTAWRVATAPLPGGITAVAAVDIGPDEKVIGRLVALQLFVGLLVVGVLGAAGYVLVRNSLRPLGEVERTAAAIAAGDLSQRVPAGDDRTEVGRLSTALNGMLARIERSFRAQQQSEERARRSAERMRRFVADASHELRTPLTSIRGFAELYRQGAAGGPEDVGRLMQRIEAEGARMGLLVEDLLLLARMDQQRPLRIAPVDLAEVAGDAVHDARAVQPDRPVALQLSDSLTEVPVVLGDEARLRQVVGNLVTNALTHTPPTAPVTVSLDEDPGDPDTVVLRVADEGPGLAPDDATRVFERFYRADTSRTRQAGGTGLGLAIVASLVAAHGGTVDLTTAEGRGATFTVRLPRSGPVPDDGPDERPHDGADDDPHDGADDGADRPPDAAAGRPSGAPAGA